jgi:hypothetical protein
MCSSSAPTKASDTTPAVSGLGTYSYKTTGADMFSGMLSLKTASGASSRGVLLPPPDRADISSINSGTCTAGPRGKKAATPMKTTSADMKTRTGRLLIATCMVVLEQDTRRAESHRHLAFNSASTIGPLFNERLVASQSRVYSTTRTYSCVFWKRTAKMHETRCTHGQGHSLKRRG